MINGQKTTFADEFVHEKLGREKGRSLKRRKDEKKEEEALKSFLDKEMKSGSTGAKYLKAIQDLQSAKDKGQEKPTMGIADDRAEEGTSSTTPFRAETVRKIGFNPAAYSDPLQGFKVSSETNKSVSLIPNGTLLPADPSFLRYQLEELRGRTKGVPIVKLGKMPGKKMSNVVNPLSAHPSRVALDVPSPLDSADPGDDDDEMVDLD